jgi:RND superfamily putative drug exporter
VAGTTRLPTARKAPAEEPQTTRFTTARSAVRNAVNNAAAATRQAARPPAPAPRPREEREIESWLGELRGGQQAPPPGTRPSAEPTRAMPEQRPLQRSQTGNEPTTAIPTQRPPQDADATTAIPTARPDSKGDPESTEKIDTRDDEDRKRRGGGVSAQDLLRREGRI